MYHFQRSTWDIDYKEMVFHLSVLLRVASIDYFENKPKDIHFKDMVSHLNVFFMWVCS